MTETERKINQLLRKMKKLEGYDPKQLIRVALSCGHSVSLHRKDAEKVETVECYSCDRWVSVKSELQTV